MRPVHFREVALGTAWGVGRLGQMGRGQTWHVERQIPEAQRKSVAVASMAGHSH